MILLIYAADTATDRPVVEEAAHVRTMPSTEEEKRVQEEQYQDEQAVTQEEVVGQSVEPIEVKQKSAAEENTVTEHAQEKQPKKNKKLKKFQKKKAKSRFHKKKRKAINKKSRCLNCETLKRFVD